MNDAFGLLAGNRRLTRRGRSIMLPVMTSSMELDLKQRLARLPERDRRAMSAYLLKLKNESKGGRRHLSKVMREMDGGRKTPLSQLATELGHA